MSQVFSSQQEVTQNYHPLQCLEELANLKANLQTSSCLQVSQGSVDWAFLFQNGQLIYATYSLDPGDRLERQLRRLSADIPTLTREICVQIRSNLDSHSDTDLVQFLDYQAIGWLVERKYLLPKAAATLVKRLSQEVFESYLLLSEVHSKKVIEFSVELPVFVEFNLPDFIEECRKNLQGWQALSSYVWSPYQRPYFFINAYAQQKISPEKQQKLGRLLKGFSFRHLAALLNQDELQLVQKLYPLIRQKAIILREPQPPFDQLPRLSNEIVLEAKDNTSVDDEKDITFSGFSQNLPSQKIWKVVCVDDSPTILKEIDRFLDSNNLVVTTINDSLKALMQIIRTQPDLILLDVGMPNVDGYKLCSLIRKSPQFKTTPIIMVTGKTGLIDRAKAKISGATDYMTKPFTQSELLKMIFRYLT